MNGGHVLHVSPLAFGQGGVVGGGERYPLELARAMAREAPTRLVTFGESRDERDGPLEVRCYRALAHVGTKRLGPVHPQLAVEIARARVVHCHQLHTFLADQCVLLARLFRKRVFLTDHAGGDRHFNHRLRTVERASGLLLVSHFNARGFARHAEKIRVIHGGVDAERFQPTAEPRRRVALYVGRLIPYKSVHTLIEGVRPETEVRVAGEAYHDDYAAHLRAVAAGRNVHFLGAVHGSDLLREYTRAGVSVLPSVETDMYGKRYPKSEILGLALLEAMACETPVVCSAIGGMPELVADGETGLVVPPGDPEALGAAVEGLLDDHARARRLGESGRARVLERFTWQRVAKTCLNAYRELGGGAALG
ncbi:MAG TPA: glycosyltransferase family 4 protein [Chloroflexota bacterium]|nr:glycosyltransferase family 4 protein [Chloroflexota bacterium]